MKPKTFSFAKPLQKGRRVFIRSLTLRDESELLSKTNRNRGYTRPWVHPPVSAVDFRNRLKKYRTAAYESYTVCLLESGEIVGVININEIVRGAFQSGYLGYYGFSEFAGQGYLTEGLQLVLRHAFSKLKLHRLEANIQPNNKPSLALVKRCGFKKEGYSPKYLKIAGRWRDHQRWTMLKENFKITTTKTASARAY